MTQNQIAYARLKEERRHNKATEDYNVAALSETNRHNIAQEGYWTDSNAINKDHLQRMDSETQRHNIANENIEAYKASETHRHNVVSEDELTRHNVSTERLNARSILESERHNLASEAINEYQSETSRLSAVSGISKNESDILVNQARVDDYQSQIHQRSVQNATNVANTAINAFRTSAEMYKDWGQGTSNIINSLSNTIKLFGA